MARRGTSGSTVAFRQQEPRGGYPFPSPVLALGQDRQNPGRAPSAGRGPGLPVLPRGTGTAHAWLRKEQPLPPGPSGTPHWTPPEQGPGAGQSLSQWPGHFLPVPEPEPCGPSTAVPSSAGTMPPTAQAAACLVSARLGPSPRRSLRDEITASSPGRLCGHRLRAATCWTSEGTPWARGRDTDGSLRCGQTTSGRPTGRCG